MESGMRYTLTIIFKTQLGERVDSIVCSFKTLREASEYEDMIDDTVLYAWLRDNVTGDCTDWV